MRRLHCSAQSHSDNRSFLPWLAGLLFGVLVLANCVSDSNKPDIQAVLNRVRLGVPREEVIASLSDAWFHSSCNMEPINRVDDVFMYGPKDRERVTLVVVRSAPSERGLVVESSGSMEGYFLNASILWETCNPPLLQAFERR